MARYSDDVLNEVRNSVDLVEIASAYVRLKRSGNSYMGCCPFHKEKTPSFHIDPDKQLYHCFGCGAGGSVFQFVMAAEGLDFPDAVKLVAERGGVRLPEPEDGEDIYRRKRDMYAMNKAAARFFRDCLFSPEGEEARAYLQKRRLTSRTVAAFGLGYSPKGWDGLLKHLEAQGFTRDMMAETGLCVRNDRGHMYDRFRDRVMFPIFDVRQNIIGFGGRIMRDGARDKYINSPESVIYNKGKNLFALNIAKKSKRGCYVLVEGYMDVISLHQAGIDCAVAGCGTALTEAQARLIAKGGAVYLCYDMDEAGQRAFDRAADIFNGLDAKLKVITIPDGKDADEYIKKYGGGKFEELIQNSLTVTEYKVERLLSKYDPDDVGQKVELLNEAAAMLGGIVNSVEREAYIRELSARTGISVQAITAEVNKAGRRQGRKALREQVVKSVAQSRGAQTGTPKSRREAAETKLLSILTESRDVYDKLKDNLNPELFSEGLHREIFGGIKECYEGGEPSAEQFLLKRFEQREEELASVIIKNDSPDDALAASEDYIRVIGDEDLKARIALAEKEGDVVLLAKLIQNKHRKAGT